MEIVSRDGLTIKQLDDFLSRHGDMLANDKRDILVRELMGMKAAENQNQHTPLARLFDPLMGQVSSAVASACYDPMADKGGAQFTMGLERFADEYITGMDAAKEVLTFLKAQTGMDLFQGNLIAKRLYESIVAAGLNEVLYNNKRWQR